LLGPVDILHLLCRQRYSYLRPLSIDFQDQVFDLFQENLQDGAVLIDFCKLFSRVVKSIEIDAVDMDYVLMALNVVEDAASNLQIASLIE
jgi:hypothetical protein